MSEKASWCVGDCVIVNDIDQPCSRLIAVIVGQRGEFYDCQYLNADEVFNSCNDPPMQNRLERATRIEDFGVVLQAGIDNYWCEQVSNSIAKYPDGEARDWQERGGPYRYLKRSEVFAHVLLLRLGIT